MKLLGIFYFQGYSDPSAAILIDGKIIAFAEEERLVRNKHAQSYFPSRAINYVLKESNLKITDIDKERAEAALKRTQEKLKDNEADLTRGRAAMDRARNRLKITSRI